MTRIVPKFSPNSLELLHLRYLQPGESPEQMLDRVSGGNEDFYNLMANMDMFPNSPTLFNKGVPGAGTFSACFKFTVEDSLGNFDEHDSILGTGVKAGNVMKWGGGVGYCLSNLRPKGSPIATTHGKAMGPVAVLKYYQSVASMITQAGKRDGAQMGILHCDHPDILDFIRCKNEDPQALSTFNISVAITDEFMRKVEAGIEPEASIFMEIVKGAWNTGDPGLFFIDAAERRNPTPHLGLLDGTNPCGEVPLLNNEPCNLGSINLGNFFNGSGLDWDRLRYTVDRSIRFLDHILDCNTFPVPEVAAAALATRKLGLGPMGVADLFALMKVHYDTDEAVALSDDIAYVINRQARITSEELGAAKGAYPAFLPAINLKPVRNATRTCTAPTGSISIIAGCSSGIEPHYALEWTRMVGANRTPMYERVPVMDRLGGFRPKVANEVAWEKHVEHQSAWQRSTDLAVSKTINMHNGATIEDVYGAYLTAWKMECKGITIYRDGCREFQVLNATHELGIGLNAGCVECGGEVVKYDGCTTCTACGISYCG